jgi:hypothetical protein
MKFLLRHKRAAAVIGAAAATAAGLVVLWLRRTGESVDTPATDASKPGAKAEAETPGNDTEPE